VLVGSIITGVGTGWLLDTYHVAGCCDPSGFDAMFTPAYAHRAARRYRRNGLDRSAQPMVDFLAGRGIAGASVLEIGGGVGEVHLELLRRGAAHATNLELSSAYEQDAAELLAETGLAARVDRRLVDIAVDPATVEPADVVVLDRVVCCYPDHARLLAAAADHAKRLLAFSYPRASVLVKAVLGAQNAVFALVGRNFRVFAHPPQAMLATLTDHGHDIVFTHHDPIWQVVGTQRRPSAPDS
jgi:SAM-dependent methyltransferase